MFSKQLDLFRGSLPYRPYCTDDLRVGLRIRPADEAIRRRYIQPNPPVLLANMVFDIDRPGGARDWKYKLAPGPNIAIENPENYHAHLVYQLEIPIYRDPLEGSRRAIRYAAAVEAGLRDLLGGDLAYRGFICKNPLHPAWTVTVYAEYAYTLDLLADYLDLGKVDLRRRAPDYGIGRNCTLFDLTRRYAYRAVRDHWGGEYKAFYDDIENHALLANIEEFPGNPLYAQEVIHVARSVAKWTWRHFTPADFSRIQAERKRKDTERRRAEAANRAQNLLDFMQSNPGATTSEAAAEFGVSLRTAKYYKVRGVQRTISGSAGFLRDFEPPLTPCVGQNIGGRGTGGKKARTIATKRRNGRADARKLRRRGLE